MEYEGIGDKYQDLTKYTRGSLPRHKLDWSAKPSLRKAYPNAIETVRLPSPATVGGPPLWDTIRARRSERSYTREPITMEQLSQLVWATQGTTSAIRNYQLRLLWATLLDGPASGWLGWGDCLYGFFRKPGGA